MANQEFNYLDKDEKIGESKFTIGFVLQCLDKSTNSAEWKEITDMNKNKENNYKTTKINITQIAGIGFLSHIYRIQFHFPKAANPKDDSSSVFSVILKVL